MSVRQNERGLSLIEITIVLLAMSIITAGVAPVAARVIDRTRLSRAVEDAEAIKAAVVMFVTDLGGAGFTGFTITGASAGTTTRMLVSDGDIPRELGTGGDALWQAVVDNTGGTVDFLGRHLITNNPRGSAANAYPTAGTDQWRGAYLGGPIDADPWGNRYAVNTRWMKDAPRTNDVFVLSAGPDEQIDTPFAVNGIVPGDDDIIAVIYRDAGASTPDAGFGRCTPGDTVPPCG
jgi:type II secretory pathway pseudopilin PulG